MNKGFLIFAQNNSDIDYCKIAMFCAKRIKQYIDLPVSIVTDSPDWLKESNPDWNNYIDKIIVAYNNFKQTKKYYDGSMANKQLEFKNLTRTDSYDLTPYEQTIVIDSDYLVSSDLLKNVFDQQYDLALYSASHDIARWRDTSSFEFLNKESIPFYWATVCYFKKTDETKVFFSWLKHIKDNWTYYRNLYKIDSGMYRNDFGFSIAVHIMNGCTQGNFAARLPGKLFYTLDRDLLIEIKEDKFKFLVEKEKYHGEYLGVKTQGVDVHVMNKYSISRIIDESTY